jgi:DNA (cytosine-5)-methyltransferase 1
LSIREGARCQSFPDRFIFLGTTDEKRLQIGNAVPPLLGKAIGESILAAINSQPVTKAKKKAK